MTFIKKITRKNKNGTTRTYYAEVKSVRDGKKVFHKYIRSLGTDPNRPQNFPIGTMEFSALAIGLMQRELTPNDVFDILERMGHPFTRDTLEKIGIRYDFGKKTFCIYLFYRKNSKISPQKNVRSVRKNSTRKKQSKGR